MIFFFHFYLRQTNHIILLGALEAMVINGTNQFNIVNCIPFIYFNYFDGVTVNATVRWRGLVPQTNYFVNIFFRLIAILSYETC